MKNAGYKSYWPGITYYYLRRPIRQREETLEEIETVEPILEEVPPIKQPEPLQEIPEPTTWLDRIMKLFRRKAA